MVGEDGQKLCEILAPNGVNIEHVRQIDFYLQDIKKEKISTHLLTVLTKRTILYSEQRKR